MLLNKNNRLKYILTTIMGIIIININIEIE